MKVSASPFEPPRGLVSPDASDASKAPADAEPEVTPAAISNVQTQIDATTRESLSRLASLIRSQQKASDAASEAAQAKARRDEEAQLAQEARAARARRAEASEGAGEEISRELVAKENYPQVERVEQTLREERRKRGVLIYSQQKTKDAVAILLSELEKTSRAA